MTPHHNPLQEIVMIYVKLNWIEKNAVNYMNIKKLSWLCLIPFNLKPSYQSCYYTAALRLSLHAV